MKKPQYGRGKFKAHPNYVIYMDMIVKHPNYSDMPGAVQENGKIVWQVSSGKSTSFYKHYQERVKWWVHKADSNKIRGTGNSDDRFSITARIIHPTGYRACRLCGQDRNVGYFYSNQRLVNKLNKLTESSIFFKSKQPIADVLHLLESKLGKEKTEKVIIEIFSERKDYFDKYGLSEEAFVRTNFIRSNYLSPGFMCNPPDRLDGFHDYCNLGCRENHDPGRSKENLSSYQHDRRVFEYWAEGDWLVADALYNKAGAGSCYICNKSMPKISPDHVGPLACGFKQIPFFLPTCISCNSSKNRRLFKTDIDLLINYEKEANESVASWQVKVIWDKNKFLVKDDADAKELSNWMRAMQDYYIRALYAMYSAGHIRFLTLFLHSELAGFKVTFTGLNTSNLTFKDYKKIPVDTKLRNSLASRTIRISFEELEMYARKGIDDRKVRKKLLVENKDIIKELLKTADKMENRTLNERWSAVFRSEISPPEKQKLIQNLLLEDKNRLNDYIELKQIFKKKLSSVGNIKVI